MLHVSRSRAALRLLQLHIVHAADCKLAARRMCQQQQLLSLARIKGQPSSGTGQQQGTSRGLSRGFAAAAGGGAPRSRGPVSYVSLGLTAVTGGALLWYYNQMMSEKVQKAQVGEATAGKTMIGGPFQLVDQNGKTFTDRDLLGKWALLYFGFTFCPDICPDELDKMAASVDSIEKGCGERVQPVFISLDPDRDTVPQVREYCAEFHPRLIGLTGSPDQCNAAAKAYRVYHMKTDETTDYLVDHSIIMYLVNPAGDFVQFYGKNFDAEAMSEAVQQHIAAAKPQAAATDEGESVTERRAQTAS